MTISLMAEKLFILFSKTFKFFPEHFKSPRVGWVGKEKQTNSKGS